MRFVRVLGLPIASPQAVVNRVVADVGAVARTARDAYGQFERMLELGEEIAAIGRSVLEVGERLDRRAGAILDLGERLDVRAEAILTTGRRLDHRGEEIVTTGERLDHRGDGIVNTGEQLDRRGAEIVDVGIRIQALADRFDARAADMADQAAVVTETASELIALLPTLERALQMATPLEGAIDRFGRLVDRLPGGRRQDQLPTERPR